MIGARTVRHLLKLVGGRQKWTASDEFAYYSIHDGSLARARRRQLQFERESHATGLRIMHGMGILDVDEIAGRDVLDIGAGEGMLSAAIAHCGAGMVWSLDAVPRQLWAAAEHHAASPNHRFVIGDCNNLPFANQSFDLVTANLVLHHVEPLAPLLVEAHRVLKPGGKFVALEPAPLVGALFHGDASENEAPISMASVKAALTRSGFRGVEGSYWWSRAQTSVLGALSPGYRILGRRSRSDLAESPTTILRRSIEESPIAGLAIDSACPFRALVESQLETIKHFVANNRG